MDKIDNLITFDNVSLAFGNELLLDHVKLQVRANERICLIGRNGAGKSSLLKVVEGAIAPDSGIVARMPQLRLARLAQELPQDIQLTVYEYVAEGLAETGQLLASYHALLERLEHSHTENDLIEIERLQQLIDAKNGWQFEQAINQVLTRLELSPQQKVSDLSGGWQRRAALARAMVGSPHVLLLDEPTNHLDIEAIKWLEEQLLNSTATLIFITHDRSLLQRLATRIIELDRGQLTSWEGDYDNFLRRKAEMLYAESQQNAEFDKKLAQEERWIRQGIKARRTRNEGRVRALEALRRTRAERREVEGKVTFNLNEAERSGKLVFEAKNIMHDFDGKIIINDFSTRVMYGDRIGLIGPNGVGKSTLLNILLGKLVPRHGSLVQGTKLQIAYSDQLRAALQMDKTVIDNVGEGREEIEVNDKKRHIISYLADFLFTPQRARTPVKALSGGECNRLLLARLFSQPSNLLVLDEPTNDLDIETLELLEELLDQYQGTLLIVSHDRTFLDNLVTSTWVFSGNGKIQEYIGGYHDYLAQHENEQAKLSLTQTIATKAISHKTATSKHKLSYKEQKELSELPQAIERLEAEQLALHHQTAQSGFYQQNAGQITSALDRLKAIEIELQQAYERWQILERKEEGSRS